VVWKRPQANCWGSSMQAPRALVVAVFAAMAAASCFRYAVMRSWYSDLGRYV